ncbi:hypothetical protein [Paenibacillus lutrae]|uniref:Uncharacterized protein n=1 Tax=Paenibacillus lutrae TaxID=2078573 RepID=A0A7X3FK47_9BACL|nr:hypothetical protein [Paenibacillus lutrae]MVP01190.1 hypothetical protein [Paenibacillus lutrae]
MQWSKMKMRMESRLCDSLKGRIQYNSTRYRGSHDQVGRAWITFDHVILHDFCTTKRSYKYNSSANSIQKENHCLDWNDPLQQKGYYQAYKLADEELRSQGYYNQYQFYDAIEEFLNLPINRAVTSENALIRSFAYVDKRVGKRTLLSIKEDKDRRVMKFLTIRKKAEGIHF